jgi:hypothetical protein
MSKKAQKCWRKKSEFSDVKSAKFLFLFFFDPMNHRKQTKPPRPNQDRRRSGSDILMIINFFCDLSAQANKQALF